MQRHALLLAATWCLGACVAPSPQYAKPAPQPNFQNTLAQYSAPPQYVPVVSGFVAGAGWNTLDDAASNALPTAGPAAVGIVDNGTKTGATSVADTYRAAARQATEAIKHCHDGTSTRGTVEEMVRCSNPTILAAYDDANFPYMDLIKLATIARLMAAEKVDAGELTTGRADIELLELGNRIEGEMRRRQSGAQSNAMSNLLYGLTIFTPSTGAKRDAVSSRITCVRC